MNFETASRIANHARAVAQKQGIQAIFTVTHTPVNDENYYVAVADKINGRTRGGQITTEDGYNLALQRMEHMGFTITKTLADGGY